MRTTRSDSPRQEPGLARGILTGVRAAGGRCPCWSAWRRGSRGRLAGPASHAPVRARVDRCGANGVPRPSSASTRKQVDRATQVLGVRRPLRHSGGAERRRSTTPRVAEGIAPELGFRLVQVESRFLPRRRERARRHGPDPGAAPHGAELHARGHRERPPRPRHQSAAGIPLPARSAPPLRRRPRAGAGGLQPRARRMVDSIATSGGDPSNGYADLVLRGRASLDPRQADGQAGILSFWPALSRLDDMSLATMMAVTDTP